LETAPDEVRQGTCSGGSLSLSEQRDTASAMSQENIEIVQKIGLEAIVDSPND
jgi:hypothetical protein